jgi:LPXTG-motif cell wall-anchored protein
MEFEFNAEGITDRSVVVFESLYSDGYEVAVHADIEDEGQTFYIPGGHTEAKNEKTRTHTARAEEKVTIIDTVYYDKLLPNKEYTVKGILMDKTTGEPLLVDGNEVTAETTFLTDADEDVTYVSGYVEMTFTFDASALEGKSVVVFETVYKDDHEVFVHADIEDEPQTVNFPKISTMAGINNGKKKEEAVKNLVIKDTIEYEGLTPGEKYSVKGILMDPATGKPLLANGKQITATAELIPDEKNGSIDIFYKFDGTGLVKPDQSMKVVVFEEIYDENNELVADHTELDDEKQTIEIYKPDIPRTGDDAKIVLMVMLMLIAAAGVIILIRRKES